MEICFAPTFFFQIAVNITDSWTSDHSPLKRRQSQQRCTSPNRDVTRDYGFSSSEITLTLLSSDSNGYKRPRRDSEKKHDSGVTSGVTLRYKDPKTLAPTEKVLDDNVRQCFGSPKDLNINQLIKKQSDEPCESNVLNKCLEKISSEISIYPKQECEKSPQAGTSTLCKSPSLKDNSQTVIKVSPEVEIITSPKSSQRFNRKYSLETSKNDVPENNTKSHAKTSDMNNNISPRPVKESFGEKVNKSIQSLVSSKKASEPLYAPVKKVLESVHPPLNSRALRKVTLLEESKMCIPNTPRDSSEGCNKWYEVWENDVNMQDVSSSMSLSDQVYTFDDDFEVERPYYVLGFPNLHGENRCWVNASVHALFALPLTNSLDSINLPNCSQLTKTLISIQSHWRKKLEREKIYTLMK